VAPSLGVLHDSAHDYQVKALRAEGQFLGLCHSALRGRTNDGSMLHLAAPEVAATDAREETVRRRTAVSSR